MGTDVGLCYSFTTVPFLVALININSQHLTNNFPDFTWRCLACFLFCLFFFKTVQQKNKAFVPGGYFHVIQESAVERDMVLINRLFNRILQIHRSVSHALKTSSVSRLHSVGSARSEMHSQPRCVWIPRTTTSTVDKCQRARPKIKEPASVCAASASVATGQMKLD